MATSALVTTTLAVYAVFDLGSSVGARRAQLETAAHDVAVSVQASLETIGVQRVLANAPAMSTEMSKATGPWRIEILPAQLIQSSQRNNPIGATQLERLRAITEFPEIHLGVQEGDTFIYVVPLRIPLPGLQTDYQPVGSLEVSRDTAAFSSGFRDDLIRTLLLIALIAAITILATTWLTRSLMTRPVEKLLAGIDDVARGDLSHVLLSERDDEIGALAMRFNDMTQSLRESRAETEQQNEARLSLEQRLGQTEKLATLGQLAAEIAHEVGTPLNVIAGRAKNLSRKARDPEAVQKNSTIIAEQTARITRIIQRLLDFTRRKVGTQEPGSVDLAELTATTLELLEGKLVSADVHHVFDRNVDLPAVKGDRDRLQQVLLNLLLNAVQAMPDGGSLRVATSRITRRRPGLEVAPEQEYVVIAVADSGKGIPPEVRDKIFEPFYTSKYDQGGTGLGLAVCHGIVKEHDGWIDITDADGGGTVFSVYLPAATPDDDERPTGARRDDAVAAKTARSAEETAVAAAEDPS